jgi:UDP-N-acetylmuramate--alanine ligase
MTDIYAAGETPIPGIGSEDLVKAIKESGREDIYYLPRSSTLIEEVIKFVEPGDVLLSLGAGDITKLGRDCAKALKKRGIDSQRLKLVSL